MWQPAPIGPQVFFFNDTAPTEIYTLSLHDALPIFPWRYLSAAVQPVHSAEPCQRKAPHITKRAIHRFPSLPAGLASCPIPLLLSKRCSAAVRTAYFTKPRCHRLPGAVRRFCSRSMPVVVNPTNTGSSAKIGALVHVAAGTNWTTGFFF